MKSAKHLAGFKRVVSLMLAMVLVLGLLPLDSAHVHAADEYSVVFTNAAGEETNTFTIGEPIYVETNGYTSTEWLSLWYYNGGWESTYRLWWYANDEKMLLWDAVWTDGFAWDGMNMPAGTYYIYYAKSEELASFTLVAPDASVTAEKSFAVVQDGKTVSITAVNYSEYSHVSVVNEDGIEVQKFFCLGRNGLTMEYELTPGEYTISMYNDWYETELAEQKTVTIEGEKPILLTTDKTEYKFGEPIIVTVNPDNLPELPEPGYNWVALHKKGESYSEVKSIYWYYITDENCGYTVDLNWRTNPNVRNENNRDAEFVAGEYTVTLLTKKGEDWYAYIDSVSITITAEIDESKTVTTPATCEADGYVTYTYTDGTTATKTADELDREDLQATGHDYTAKPEPVEGVVGKHVYTCGNNDAHTKQEDCVWDEGKVTVEPEVGKDGEMTYTCTLCAGERTEAISAKKVDHTDTFEATCTKGSYKIDYYTDGTNSGEISTGTAALGHSYGKAAHNEGSDPSSHTKTCTRVGCTDAQANHSVTENCSFESGAVAGGTRHSCSGCDEYYDVIIMSTNKTEYALGEPILITVDPSVYDETANDWVGIWEGNLSHTDDISIYYYYPASEGWTDFNIKNSSVHQMPTIQKYELGVGTYTLRMYTERNGDWYVPVTSVTITIGPAVRDESKTVRVEPTCEADGSITYYLTDGTLEKVVTADEDASLKALGHDYADAAPNYTTGEVGDKQNAEKYTHTKTCSNNTMDSCTVTEACAWNAGEQTKDPSTTETGEMTFICTGCGGTVKEVLPKLDAKPTGETDVVKPTCTTGGYTRVWYDDGSYKDENVQGPLGHDFVGVEWKHVEGTKTHSRTCTRNCGEAGATEIEDCRLETNGVASQNALFYNCLDCGDYYEAYTPSNKTVYEYGEDIIVYLNEDYRSRLSNGSKDWVGIYKRGEVPQDPAPKAIFWTYVTEIGEEGFVIQDGIGGNREEEFTAGEYTLILCANDGYEIIGKRNITITASVTERKTTQPTCEDDGYITAYYSDGTSKVVVTAEDDESLKATGHNYTGNPEYNGEEHQTHKIPCVNGCGTYKNEDCDWDQGVVTEEATEEKDGLKTYTCQICDGEKTEIITKKTIVETVRQEPTCEESGSEYYVYSDGSQSEPVVIPAKQHSYSGWVFDVETKTHTKTCSNNTMDSCVVTEDCEFASQVNGSSVTHTCKVCSGSYVSELLVIKDTTIGLHDHLDATVYDAPDGAWVGIYKKGDVPGSIVSLYWYDVTADRIGVVHNVLDPNFYNTERNEMISNGEYVVYLFGDQGYNNILCAVDVTIFTDMSNSTFEIQIDGETKAHGSSTYYNIDDVGAGKAHPLKINVATTGEVGAYWLGLYKENHSLETDFNGVGFLDYYYIKDQKAGGDVMNGGNYEAGKYALVLFADGTYDKPVQVVNFEVGRTIVERTTLLEATCTEEGMDSVLYKGETEPVVVMTEPLGHSWGKWTSNGDNTHSRTCARDAEHVETNDCVFEDDVCTECSGDKVQIHVHGNLTKYPSKPATCTEDGNKAYYTCECGEWFYNAQATEVVTNKADVVISRNGHSWKNATCSDPKTCDSCGATEGSALGHDWSDATCSAPKTCGRCGTTEGEALGHKFGKWIYNASTKTHTHTCANDSKHTETKACSFGEAVITKPAVGNNAGEKTYTCTVCSGTYTESYKAAASYDRVWGADRYKTAYATADQLKQNLGVEKFSAVVVASGTEFADALSGSYLANQKGAPILLVRNNKTTMSDVKDYIKKNLAPGGTVYLLGGEKAVPKAMETGLEGFNIKRLAGATRYETNLEILKEAGVAGQDILICTGKDFADSLSASAVNRPILLVKDNLNDAQKQFLTAAKAGKLYIIGGTNAVSIRIENQLKGYGTIERISGATRYHTSANIAATFYPTSDCAVLTYGQDFPDGLCGGVLANSMGAPMLLVAKGKDAPAKEYTTKAGINSGVVLGGTKLINDTVAKAVLKIS